MASALPSRMAASTAAAAAPRETPPNEPTPADYERAHAAFDKVAKLLLEATTTLSGIEENAAVEVECENELADVQEHFDSAILQVRAAVGLLDPKYH